VQHSNGNIKSKCSTQMVVLKVSVAQMAVFKVRVALTWQYSKTFYITIWVLHLLSILPFECYTYFQYYHLSATLTCNTVIWVLHLFSILPFECCTFFQYCHLSITLSILPFECYTYFQYYHLNVTLTFNTAIWVLH
jgi:predicted secreted protein